MAKKSKREYSEEFKREAVALVESGRSVASVVAELGISASALQRWRTQGLGKAPTSKAVNLEEELQKTRKELHQVKQERDLLKKSIALFVKTDS